MTLQLGRGRAVVEAKVSSGQCLWVCVILVGAGMGVSAGRPFRGVRKEKMNWRE